MKIVYFSNFINHHQVPLADELYHKIQGQFYFVELKKIDDVLIRSGYQDFSDRPYLVKAWRDEESIKIAEELCWNADVAIFGADSLQFEKARARTGKLSFEVSERWLKRGLFNLLSPLIMKYILSYHTIHHNKPVYKLCASAYASNDQYLLRTYINRCYKWGYFTKVEDLDVASIITCRRSEKICRIMWCARFIGWKHPEIPVRLAARLKEKGYEFCVDMYGSGPMLEKTRQLAIKLKVADIVHFKGNLPNEQILKEMQGHDIFIFTSDRREGWGAVANEAMSNGCVLVASDEIGSVPYLVKDGVNGCVFKSGDMNSLIEKVESLINDRDYMGSLALNAYNTMKNEWSPACAARNLLLLIADLQSGKDTSITDGPCSKALPINHA